MTNEAEKQMKGSVHQDDFYIFHSALVLMKAKETINWMKQNRYLHQCLLPLNGLQDGITYASHPVGNIPEFMPLDNSLNRDILHSLCMHDVLSCYILDGEETDDKERNMCFSYSTPREISQGIKHTWDSKMGGTPSSARIIQVDDLTLKAFEISYHTNGATDKGLTDGNRHRRKYLGERKSFCWGGAKTKGEGIECELTKNMFFHHDLLQLCLKK